jgi:organic hydroperoxide reductase OsmC/OhrA
LTAEAVGDVELEGKVLVIRRIHVRFTLKAPRSQQETAERVHGVYADHCPVYRSIKDCIAVTTELSFVAEDSASS